jgi:hypothetical protein
MPPSHYLLNSRHIYSLYTSNAPTHSWPLPLHLWFLLSLMI